ncbi:MAG: class II fructose-bisphosphate aldolase [Gemmatimonadota bacterium]|nr:class II fructose-bisphosphate aldolase [Gemmatimonadota bacterium]
MIGALSGVLSFSNGDCAILDEDALRGDGIDRLVHTAVFAEEESVRDGARWLIRRVAETDGCPPASIHEFYVARSTGAYPNVTVPAINLRGMTYDMARALFRAAAANDAGAVICEIARSEIGYTRQRPAEYTAVVLGAAIKESFHSPVFIQGDHFQVKAKNFFADPDQEIAAVKDIIVEGVAGGFFNIDVDASTLVDLDQPTVSEQQYNNSHRCAELTAKVREVEPEGVIVSVGGEIGEVGGKNSTVEEFRAFMDGFNQELAAHGEGLVGLSKISIQTGTAHGGVPLPDGTIADVQLDLEALESISRVARDEYGQGGAVQHGASTLPESAFGHFPRTETTEIHLATGFQNQVYDGGHLPKDLVDKVHDWLRENCAGERKEGDSETQFLYKTRKKGFGPFKAEFWGLPESVREAIGKDLEEKFDFYMKILRVEGTRKAIAECVTVPPTAGPPPESLGSLVG